MQKFEILQQPDVELREDTLQNFSEDFLPQDTAIGCHSRVSTIRREESGFVLDQSSRLLTVSEAQDSKRVKYCDLEYYVKRVMITPGLSGKLYLHEGGLLPIGTILQQNEQGTIELQEQFPMAKVSGKPVQEPDNVETVILTNNKQKKEGLAAQRQNLPRVDIGVQSTPEQERTDSAKTKNRSFSIHKRQNFTQVNQRSLIPRTSTAKSQVRQKDQPSKNSMRLEWLNDQPGNKFEERGLRGQNQEPAKPKIMIRRVPQFIKQKTQEQLAQFIDPHQSLSNLNKLSKILKLAEEALRQANIRHLQLHSLAFFQLRLDALTQMFDIFKRRAVDSLVLLVKCSFILLSYCLAYREKLGALSRNLQNLIGYSQKNVKFMIQALNRDKIDHSRSKSQRKSPQRKLNWDTFANNNAVLEDLLTKSWKVHLDFLQLLKKMLKSRQPQRQRSRRILLQFTQVVYEQGLLSKIGYLGVAPRPYLGYKGGYTLALNPAGVLFYWPSKREQPHLFNFAQKFVQTMSYYYSLVFYSDLSRELLQKLCEPIKQRKDILHRSYFSEVQGKRVFQGRQIGREFRRVLVLDVEQSTCQQNLPNSILVRHNSKKSQDHVLANLIEPLVQIVEEQLMVEEGVERIRQTRKR